MATNRIKLTKRRLDQFAAPKEATQAFLWDSEVPGFGLRVTESGNKAFVFQSRLNGQALRYTIGSADAWDIDAARKEARHLAMQIDQGIDFRIEKREKVQRAKQQRQRKVTEKLTLGDAWNLYVNDRQKDWSADYAKDHHKVMREPGLPKKRGKGKTVAGVLFGLKSTPLASLTPDQLAAWMDRESAKRPTQAALGFRMLRAFFSWCADQPGISQLVDGDRLLGKRLRRMVPKPKAKGDSLQREQLPLWFAGVREQCQPVIAAYLQTLLLTGARREELSRLRWEDVDFRWQSLRLNDKVEDERIIPLTPYVASMLKGLPRESEWVFASASSASGHLVEPRAAHQRALKAAGLPSITLHGLPRSFASLAEWVEVPAGITAQIMGHKPSALAEKHYRVRPLDLLRQWHERIESWILQEGGFSGES
jgi:integrase